MTIHRWKEGKEGGTKQGEKIGESSAVSLIYEF